MDTKIKDDRRDFLLKSAKIAGVTFCGCVFGSLLTACDKDEMSPAPPMPTGDYPIVKVADIPALSAVGGFSMQKLFYKDGSPANGGRSVFVFRFEANKFATLDTICLHKNANVNVSNGVLTCELHAAKFESATGAITDIGFAGETFPPLRVFPNEFDALTNELKIKV